MSRLKLLRRNHPNVERQLRPDSRSEKDSPRDEEAENESVGSPTGDKGYSVVKHTYVAVGGRFLLVEDLIEESFSADQKVADEPKKIIVPPVLVINRNDRSVSPLRISPSMRSTSTPRPVLHQTATTRRTVNNPTSRNPKRAVTPAKSTSMTEKSRNGLCTRTNSAKPDNKSTKGSAENSKHGGTQSTPGGKKEGTRCISPKRHLIQRGSSTKDSVMKRERSPHTIPKDVHSTAIPPVEAQSPIDSPPASPKGEVKAHDVVTKDQTKTKLMSSKKRVARWVDEISTRLVGSGSTCSGRDYSFSSADRKASEVKLDPSLHEQDASTKTLPVEKEGRSTDHEDTTTKNLHCEVEDAAMKESLMEIESTPTSDMQMEIDAKATVTSDALVGKEDIQSINERFFVGSYEEGTLLSQDSAAQGKSTRALTLPTGWHLSLCCFVKTIEPNDRMIIQDSPSAADAYTLNTFRNKGEDQSVNFELSYSHSTVSLDTEAEESKESGLLYTPLSDLVKRVDPRDRHDAILDDKKGKSADTNRDQGLEISKPPTAADCDRTTSTADSEWLMQQSFSSSSSSSYEADDNSSVSSESSETSSCSSCEDESTILSTSPIPDAKTYNFTFHPSLYMAFMSGSKH